MVISSLEENAKVSILGVTSYFKSLEKIKIMLSSFERKAQGRVVRSWVKIT